MIGLARAAVSAVVAVAVVRSIDVLGRVCAGVQTPGPAQGPASDLDAWVAGTPVVGPFYVCPECVNREITPDPDGALRCPDDEQCMWTGTTTEAIPLDR